MWQAGVVKTMASNLQKIKACIEGIRSTAVGHGLVELNASLDRTSHKLCTHTYRQMHPVTLAAVGDRRGSQRGRLRPRSADESDE